MIELLDQSKKSISFLRKLKVSGDVLRPNLDDCFIDSSRFAIIYLRLREGRADRIIAGLRKSDQNETDEKIAAVHERSAWIHFTNVLIFAEIK